MKFWRTCESLSHETPKKEQWAIREEEFSQSFRPEPLGPVMADLIFNRTSRSLLFAEERDEKRKKTTATWRSAQMR
jgi:hypothetical protein